MHSAPEATGVAYSEIYEFWHGRGLVYMQDRATPDVEDVIVVEAGPGDKVVIPPGWAHATVNLGDGPMAFGAVYALEAQLLYEPLRKLQGTAHYVLADGTLEPNPRYRSVPPARRAVPHEIPEHGIGHGRPALSGEPALLDLVSRPERYPAVWERLVRAELMTRRSTAIVEEVLREGEVSVEALAARLDVSLATVRRDLAGLERQGLVRRTHGGAAAVSAVAYEAFRHDSSFQEQEGRHAEEKRRIGLAAAELVKDGETIGLTPGTTATQVARSLRHRKGITVVTNTVNVAMELCDREDLTVYVTGGYLRGGWFSLVGARAASGVREVFLDKVFLGVNAIHAERGLTCLHPEEAAINRALVGQARERIVVADRSKLGRVVRCLICPTSEVHVLITDRDASDEEIRPFREKGIEVRRA